MIDGSGLPLLTEEHLTSTMNMKLGPALKLRSVLAKKLGTCSVCLHCNHCHNSSGSPEPTNNTGSTSDSGGASWDLFCDCAERHFFAVYGKLYMTIKLPIALKIIVLFFNGGYMVCPELQVGIRSFCTWLPQFDRCIPFLRILCKVVLGFM